MTAQMGPEGVLFVDTSNAATSDALLTAIRKLGDQQSAGSSTPRSIRTTPAATQRSRRRGARLRRTSSAAAERFRVCCQVEQPSSPTKACLRG